MHALWSSVVEPVLDAAEPAPTVVLIGSDDPLLTPLMVRYCRARGGVAHVIAGSRSTATHEADGNPTAVEHHEGASIDVLSRVGRIDVALIDGSRDGRTLSDELSALEYATRPAGRFPLVVVHAADSGDLGSALAEAGRDGHFTFAAAPDAEDVSIVTLRRASQGFNGSPASDAGPAAAALRAPGQVTPGELDDLVRQGTLLAREIEEARRARRGELARSAPATPKRGDRRGGTIAGLENALRRVRWGFLALSQECDDLSRRLQDRYDDLRKAAAVNGELEEKAYRLERSHDEARADEQLRLAQLRDLQASLERAQSLAETLQTRLTEVENGAREERLRDARALEDATAELQLAGERLARHQRTVLEQRERLAGHVRRLARSRSWRYGHALARSLRVITRRRGRRSAVDVLLAELESPPASGIDARSQADRSSPD